MTRALRYTSIVLLTGLLLVACSGYMADESSATVAPGGGGSTRAAGREATFSVTASTTEDSCGWRKCEVDPGPLSCKGAGEVCDMFRNRCVPACQGSDCCAGVSCPEASACAPAVGRCGTPAGQGCFDMGTTWWTGRDIPPGQRQVPENPSLVTFEVYNDGGAPLYFESRQRQPVRFDLYQQYCGCEQKLELAENHFCPSRCPDQGPARERDCAKPPRVAQRLPAGENVSFAWSGAEEVGMRRICDRAQGQFCLVSRVTLSGTYTVEVCAHTCFDGGQPAANDPNRLIMATPTGERQCRRVKFQHPATAPVVIRFDG